jgi:hypothetical protein
MLDSPRQLLSPSHPDVLAARRSPADSGLAALRQGPARRHPLRKSSLTLRAPHKFHGVVRAQSVP